MISELAGDGWRFELGSCRRFVVWTGRSGRAIVDENGRGTRNAARHDHVGRSALPSSHQDRRSARRFGQRYAQITAWLDENWGADGWAMTPSGMRGVLNDAASIYFLDATLASAFVARWCAGYKVETTDGVFRVRNDEPAARTGASLHRTP